MKLAAVVVIKTFFGEVLLLQRRPNDRTISGFCLPGGKIDINSESIVNGLIREVFEETGFQLLETDLNEVQGFVAKNGTNVSVFEYTVPDTFNVKLSQEHIGYLWSSYLEDIELAGNTSFAIKSISPIGLDYVFPKHSKYAGKSIKTILKTDKPYVRYWIQNSPIDRELNQLLIEKENQLINNETLFYNFSDSQCDCGGYHRGLCDKCDCTI